MKIHWHRLDFSHACGRQGTILEICVSCDGGFIISGVCAICGNEFSIEDTFAVVMARSAIADYVRSRSELNDDDILGKFEPKGKPS